MYLDELRADLDVQVVRDICPSCYQEPVCNVLSGTGYFVSLQTGVIMFIYVILWLDSEQVTDTAASDAIEELPHKPGSTVVGSLYSD